MFTLPSELRQGEVGGAYRVWVVPFPQVNVCGVVIKAPSTDIILSLVGFDVTVIRSITDWVVVLVGVWGVVVLSVWVVVRGVKVAFSVMGPFIVTVAEAEVPLYEPEPAPVHETKVDPFQEVKVKPLLGVARMGTWVLAFCHSVGGVVVPPGVEWMVRRYCCWYMARMVVGELGAMRVCVCAPPSDHD